MEFWKSMRWRLLAVRMFLQWVTMLKNWPCLQSAIQLGRSTNSSGCCARTACGSFLMSEPFQRLGKTEPRSCAPKQCLGAAIVRSSQML